MKFCNAPNCNNPVFGKGFCRNHQFMRQDFDRRSIVQRGIDKHKANPQPKITKPSRFVLPEKELNSEIKFVTPTPKSFDGERIDATKMDEMGMYGKTGIIENVGMDAFWKYAEAVIAKGGSKCWECGDIISRADYRNSTGHIFPKSIFGSVADNKYNFVVVGCRCGCHHKTHTLATFSQMSIFPTAVNRYMKFGHLITENHKYLDLFLDYANQIM